MQRRQSDHHTHHNSHAMATVQENTYKMEPRRKFQEYKARRVLTAVVNKWLNYETEYTSDLAANLTTVISQESLQQMKALSFDRYRYVVQTHIGQKSNQGLQVSSRAIFDNTLDNFAEYSFENKTLWCVALAYGIYYE